MPDRSPSTLEPIFRPRSIAVVGASAERGSIGFALVHNLVLSEFEGAIFPVNPKGGVIHSLKAYPTVGDIPDPVDLGLIAVPKGAVPGVVDECLAKGVRGLVVITAGFSETGEEGQRLEREIVEKVRAAGVRMVGPNCMGVINTEAGVSMNATFAPTAARPGSVGFVSQSGALGVAILNATRDMGIGLTQFVSMGNKADVSGNDLIEYWEDDPATRVICMYLESFGNPRNFTAIAKRAGRKKPILIVKSGRTAEGARAASSHTGAIAGTDITVSAFLEQCGVLRANTIEELFDITMALDRCPLPAGRRVGIVTNAGGPGIMATDACVNLRLDVGELSAGSRAKLSAFLPPTASVGNPVDMIASAGAEEYRRAIEVVSGDPDVDMLMVINVTPIISDPTEILEAIREASRGCEKPIVVVMMATEEFFDFVHDQPDLPPVYRFPESAARALSYLQRYARWRERPAPEPVERFAIDEERVERILAEAPDGHLPPESVFGLLEAYGIPTAGWRLAATRAEAIDSAERIGYPVVIKANAPGLVHKSDVGAVQLDLRSRAEVEAALDAMEIGVAEAGHAIEGYLVQEMAKGGHEVIFGLSIDPRFGPLLMFGLGGKYVEVFRDVRFAVTPLDRREADELIRRIRGFKLLTGVRGEKPADLDVLAEILLRLAQLADDRPEIVELDINPFLAAADRREAKAVDARIRVDRPRAPSAS